MKYCIEILISIFIVFNIGNAMNYGRINSIKFDSLSNSEHKIVLTKHEMLFVYMRLWGVLVFTTSENKNQYNESKSIAFEHLDKIQGGCSQEQFKQILVDLYHITKPGYTSVNPTVATVFQVFPVDSLILSIGRHKSGLSQDVNVKQLIPSKYFLKEPEKNHYYWNDPEVSLFGNRKVESNYSLQTSTYFAICKYWNTVNYFYPYKNEINNWSDVLWKYILKGDSVLIKKDYFSLITQLTTEINDLHAFYSLYPIDSLFGQFQIGLNVHYLNPNFVITTILDTIKFKSLPVKVGDSIIAINNIPVRQYVDSIVQYISGGRPEVKYMEMERYLLFGRYGASLFIKTNRDTFSVTCTMKRFSKEYMSHSPIAPEFINLNDKIVYINYGAVKSKRKLCKYFISATNTNQDILIDMTQIYHGNTHPALSNFITDNSCTYAQVKYLDENSLGNLKMEDLKIIRNKRSWKDTHSNTINQNLYVLINEGTRSHGEFVSQILIHCLGGIPIGRPTAGCDGDIRMIKLPFDFWTSISGIGIYGPEMQQYQINGIQPVKYIPARPEEFIGNYRDFLNSVVNDYIYK